MASASAPGTVAAHALATMDPINGSGRAQDSSSFGGMASNPLSPSPAFRVDGASAGGSTSGMRLQIC